MNLEYEISLEYDLAFQQTGWEYSLEKDKIFLIPIRCLPTVIFIVSICFIVLGLFEQNDYNSGSSIGIGLVLLVSGVALFFILGKNSFLFSYSHNQLQKQWSEYYAQRNKINIILIPEEFILKTKDSEKAYTWKALKSLDEYSTGFIIDFFSEYSKFIPKSVFSNESEINEFKQLVKQYKSK